MQPPQDEMINFNMDKNEIQDTKEFVNNMCEFIEQNKLLYHLDISGMNLNND